MFISLRLPCVEDCTGRALHSLTVVSLQEVVWPAIEFVTLDVTQHSQYQLPIVQVGQGRRGYNIYIYLMYENVLIFASSKIGQAWWLFKSRVAKKVLFYFLDSTFYANHSTQASTLCLSSLLPVHPLAQPQNVQELSHGRRQKSVVS